MQKVLIATEKPFAPAAKDMIIDIIKENNLEPVVLEKYTDKQQLLDAVKDVTALIVRSDKIDREVMEAAPNLKVVVRAGAGYDNVDCEAATEKGICVMNTPGQNSNAVAELAFALLLFHLRKRLDGTSGSELKDRTIGIFSYGNIGRQVARIATGFGMNVLCLSRRTKENGEMREGYKFLKDRELLFEKSDIVSLSIPNAPDTKGCVNYDLLKRMPKGAILVNTARKEVINEDDLLKFLKERPDVSFLTDIQPVKHEEFLKLGNQYFATPKKMGAQTGEANRNAGVAAAKQIAEYLKTGEAPFRVNK